jgi:hypothetical protein
VDASYMNLTPIGVVKAVEKHGNPIKQIPMGFKAVYCLQFPKGNQRLLRFNHFF